MIENKVKAKWQKKEVVVNSFLSIPNTFTAEIMSEQGYDALTIDYQHGMIGFSDLFKCCKVLEIVVSLQSVEFQD